MLYLMLKSHISPQIFILRSLQNFSTIYKSNKCKSSCTHHSDITILLGACHLSPVRDTTHFSWGILKHILEHFNKYLKKKGRLI